VRTRIRRLLILLATIALLSYFFGNTLQTAYQSAAVLRRRSEYLDNERWEEEHLGPHISEFEKHPIEQLMENAKKEWEEKVSRQSRTPEEGIKEYKRRYKRDPPDGYTEWFEHAKSTLALRPLLLMDCPSAS
jgi:Ni/Co efflux regulator RcnB